MKASNCEQKCILEKLHVHNSLYGNFTTREIHKFNDLVNGVFALNMGKDIICTIVESSISQHSHREEGHHYATGDLPIDS